MPEDAKRMYYVGICRICGTGPLGLRSCGGCGEVVVLCDECDAVWTDSHLEESPQPAFEVALPCPHCDACLSEPPSHWATRAEIDSCAWVSQGLESGEFELAEAQGFTPLPNPLQKKPPADGPGGGEQR